VAVAMVAQTAWVELRGEDGRERKGETSLVRVSFYFLTFFLISKRILLKNAKRNQVYRGYTRETIS
jgi:hypothetical protein